MTALIATPQDVDAICGFGLAHIPDHYRPLIGSSAARAQVEDWWTQERIAQAVDVGRVVIVKTGEQITGVAEWGLYEGEPVVWKLYVQPARRGEGIGPALLAIVTECLPPDANRLRVEHFEANTRAAAFYEREGFTLMRTDRHATDPLLDVVWRERTLTSER